MKTNAKETFGLVAALMTAGAALAGVRYGEHNLVDYARRTSAGGLDIVSQAGENGDCWDDNGATNAFDGNVSTYFDPKYALWDTYVGYDLTTPCHLTRVRFHGRDEAGVCEPRLAYCCVTGIETNGQPFADTTDFFRTRDMVPTDWRTTAPGWFEVVPKAETRNGTYVGFRFGERSSYKYQSSGKTFCGNIAELEFYGMTEASYKAFDGDRETVLELAAGDTIERNFGTAVPIAEVRVVYASAAAIGDTIEVSAKDNFSSRSTVHTVAAEPEVGKVVTYTLFNVSGKCIRYVSKNGGQIAEIEFIPATKVAGATFTRKLSGVYDPYFAVRFTPALGNGGTTKVYRGPGRGGPWSLVKTLGEGVAAWDDTENPQAAGAVCYYRFVNAYPFDGGEVEMSEATVVRAPIRDEHLERTADCLTQLAPGRSIIANCSQKCWSPSTSTDWSVISNSMAFAFDNNLGGYFTDIQKKDPHTALGVDFGEPCQFTQLRLYYANTNVKNTNRIVNVKFAGSNNANWVKDGNFTVLTEDFTQQGIKRWYEATCLTNEAFRYCFVYNSRDNAWGCNASELQYFGYWASALADLAVGVENFRVVKVDASANVHLAWDAAESGGTCALQRKKGDGDWETLASGLSATTYTDALAFDNAVFSYRVVTSNGENTAFSETLRVQMYARGGGTGLYAQVTAPFVSTGVDPASETTTLPAVAVGDVDFPALAGGAFAKWTGRLIVPIDGTYAFDADEDEYLCVWVDETPVYHLAAEEGGVTKRSVNLTAGEHDIVVTAYRNGAGKRAALYWQGPVVREEIPASQFLPAAPSAMPEGWSTMRSFAGSAATYYPADFKVRADGSIIGAFGGNDLWKTANGYFYTCKAVTGDFTFTARIDRYADILTQCKAGLMLRSSLDAMAPFEGYLFQLYVGKQKTPVCIGGKRRTKAGAGITDYWTIGAKKSWELSCPSGGAYFRVKRVGSNVKVYVRDTRNDPWTLAFDSTLGTAYGDTVYFGLALAGSSADYCPRFAAVFSDYRFRDSGSVVIVR